MEGAGEEGVRRAGDREGDLEGHPDRVATRVHERYVQHPQLLQLSQHQGGVETQLLE